jgi:hypothetical protein
MAAADCIEVPSMPERGLIETEHQVIMYKLDLAVAILDLVFTLDAFGGVDSLCDSTLSVAVGAAMEKITEAQNLLHAA